MDGLYEFEKLATKNGEVVAIVSSDTIGTGYMTEKGIFRLYEKAKAHNAQMPDDLKALSSQHMAINQHARAKIQEAKMRYSIPLDTPPVDLNAPKNFDAAANDPDAVANDHVYGLTL